MPSMNINTSDDAAIRARGRELGINNWHNMRMDNLRERIAEAEKAQSAEALTAAPVLSQPTLTQPTETLAKEPEPVAQEQTPVEKPAPKPAQKSIDDMTDAEIIAAAEAEKARQFLREAQAKKLKDSTPRDKVNMEDLISKAPKVMIEIPFQEGKPLERAVCVNGVKMVIPVATPTLVPQPLAEALNDAMRAEYANYRNFKQGEQRFKNRENVIYR